MQSQFGGSVKKMRANLDICFSKRLGAFDNIFEDLEDHFQELLFSDDILNFFWKIIRSYDVTVNGVDGNKR